MFCESPTTTTTTTTTTVTTTTTTTGLNRLKNCIVIVSTCYCQNVSLKERDLVEDLDVDERMILKFIVNV
jgi:hypothetical protein